MTGDIHSCGPFCERPECVEQRMNYKQPEVLQLADRIDPNGVCLNNWRDLQGAAAELRRLHAENEALRKAYRKARNAAAGLTNYCEESASSRRCERELDEAEDIFRGIVAAMKGTQ